MRSCLFPPSLSSLCHSLCYSLSLPLFFSMSLSPSLSLFSNKLFFSLSLIPFLLHLSLFSHSIYLSLFPFLTLPLSYTHFLSNSPSLYFNSPVYVTYSIFSSGLSFDSSLRSTHTSYNITALHHLFFLSLILSYK